jgi:hypothetical protein
MQAGEPEKAVECCLRLGHWEGAASVADAARLPNQEILHARILEGRRALNRSGYVMPLASGPA